MATVHDDDGVGFEDGMFWLPSHVLDEACDTKKAISSVKKWSPDQRLVTEAFKVLEEQAHIEGAEQLLVILRNAGHVNTNIYNLLLRTYAKAGKMPLIVAERMKTDNVQLDEETHRLLNLTSKMCVGDASRILS
ncbi:hypothetical protein TanjilG_24606 [Lupinus angustifolius]|uniref:Pentacotripeptide-repeat region of PRORP domain-containing protein n=1 Tax=Lupinus angustifolius TaxID=3871 RepID=A0A4P1RKN2_LUPAN|nr:hypothetical protein TanjilG_24606 [Lupinus angustifolius]